jgi:hypothetical protein
MSENDRGSLPPPAPNRSPRVHERYAWVLLLLVGVGTLAIGVGDFALQQSGDTEMVAAMTGMSWAQLQASSPAVANLVDLLARVLGAWLIGFALLGITISVTAFRRGERWAWFAMWSFPLVMSLVSWAFLTADRVSGESTPPALYSAPALVVISSAGLLLSFRRFFASDGGHASNVA